MAKAKRRSGLHPLSYLGVEPLTPNAFIVEDRDPTTNDTNFNLGDEWLNSSSQEAFKLVSLSGGVAVWSSITTSGGAATNYVTDGGVAMPSGGNLNIVGGTNIATAGAGNTVTLNFSGTLQVASGGTGVTSLTDHGVLIGSGTGGVSATAVGTDGQVLTGNTMNDPTFENIGTRSGLTNNAVVLAQGNSAFVASNVGTDGQVLIGATGGVPAFATITSTGGTITITPGANSLNLEATGGGGTGITWNEVTGTSQAMLVNNGYITNNAALVTCTLPAVASVGDVIEVSGKGAGGWKIAQNAGQTIYFGDTNTTTGVGGSLASTVDRDAIRLVCVTANNDWNVLSVMGNITVV